MIIRKTLAETVNIADVGALEAVNRLVVVADRHDVRRVTHRIVGQVE